MYTFFQVTKTEYINRKNDKIRILNTVLQLVDINFY